MDLALDLRGATTASGGISSFRLDVGRLTVGVGGFAAIAARSAGRMRVVPTGETPVLLRREDIGFHQSIAGGVVFAGDDRSGIPGGAHRNSGGLLYVRWRLTTGLNLCLLST